MKQLGHICSFPPAMPIWVCLGSFLFRLYPEQYGVVLLCPASGFSALVTDCNLFLFRKTHRPFFFAHSLWTDIFFALLASDTSFHCVLISTFGGYLIIGVDPFFVILHYLYTIFIRLCCIIYSSSTLYTWLCIIYTARSGPLFGSQPFISWLFVGMFPVQHLLHILDSEVLWI